MNYTLHYTSPFGGITLASDGEALTGLWFDGQRYFPNLYGNETGKNSLPVFVQTKEWLDIYFTGRDPGFTPPIKLLTTQFRREVCEIMLTIPFGSTSTYGEIAAIISERRGGEKMSAQAVGGAVGHNPISLIIPCHRVIGNDGSLTGYAGGTELKRKLLKMEGAAFKNGDDV
ncbi:MAG: methylated-DNA--[Oscillospiraceae bacterium]|nr:methylated-DNA--[protein]-cysteine S-methyltransferase [Oscillospiraceae bacterium]